MQEGLVATNNSIGTSTETLEKINKLSSLTEQLAQLKE